jgi:hypothetical protein
MLLLRVGLAFVISQIKLGIQPVTIGNPLCLLPPLLLKIRNFPSASQFILPAVEVNPAEAIQLSLQFLADWARHTTTCYPHLAHRVCSKLLKTNGN